MAFRFGNDTVKIEIEDCIFYVSISQELHEIMLSNNVKMTELKEKITDKSDKEKESDIIPEFDNIIDNVLGKGASKKYSQEEHRTAMKEWLFMFMYAI